MHSLTKEYTEKQKIYDDFKLKSEVLIKELLVQNDINFHKIDSRCKTTDRLEEKIHRKDDKYNSLDEITDLVGLRVITYFEDEVDKVASIISSEFEIDTVNSIDKRKLEADRFGYRSLHYVVSLKESRKKLTEYGRFKDFKFEIQVKSILQHAWAEIEHDIGYKGELSIPDFLRRNFYRVAALLETADIEFVNIKKQLKEYENTISQTIKTNPEVVEINLASLQSYLVSSKIVKEIDEEIAKTTKSKISGSYSISPFEYLERFRFLNINSIKEIDKLLNQYKDKITAFSYYWTGADKREIGTFSPGVSLFYLCYVLVGLKDNLEFSELYVNNFFKRDNNPKKFAKRIIEIFNKIS